MTSQSVLNLSGISKSFGGVSALDGAGLEVRPGEIHGLVGENGAGKSTLINIATGVLRPDAGDIALQGESVAISNPRHAAGLGIAVVHQEADLFPQLSVAENMLLGQGLVRNQAGLVDWRATNRTAQEQVERLGERIHANAPVEGLPIARRMMAEIAAAVSEDARVLFLDEPTSSLTRKEIDNLFSQIRRLRDEGVGIVYVSHRLEEVLALCDRVTVMRDGETIETLEAAETTIQRIVASMVGRELSQMYAKRPVTIGDVRLSVEGLTDKGGAFTDLSLEVRAGEIVGCYGFVGAGRSEFAQTLFGLRKAAAGTVTMDGEPIQPRTPREAVRAGLAYLPEDRLVQAVFRGHALRSNASVTALKRLSTATWIDQRRERRLAEKVMKEMRVRAASQEQPIVALSGGNQQKVVFGRWQAMRPKALILDEPTRGVDVGAKAEIHRLICGLADQGTAILMISSELPEIMAMSDRVATLSEGRKSGEFDPAQDGEEAVAAAAVPRSEDEAAGAAARVHPAAKLLQFRELGLTAFVLVLFLGMGLFNPKFISAGNFWDILMYASIPAIMAQGVMLVICAGGIDISIGSMLALAAAVTALAANAGLPAFPALVLALALGCGLSLLNGAAALLARIHPIIVTLAGLGIYRGLMLVVIPSTGITQLPTAYRVFGNGDLWGVPKVCYFALGVTLLTHVFLRYTIWGRRVLALGNSESAAKLIGLSKWRLTLLVFGVSGACVGLAAVLKSGFDGNIQGNMARGMELEAIAAAVIGGTNIMGGRGSALGALLGAFLVALVYTILIVAEANEYWHNVFVGALILAAVVLDVLVQRLRRAQA